MRRWKQETEEEIDRSPVLTTLFRNTIVEALPTPVLSRLEDVVGLTSMSHEQFRDHVVHAVDRYRRDEKRMHEQDKNVQRKIARLQLGELQGTSKAKSQAAVVTTRDVQAPSDTTAPVMVVEARNIAPPQPVRQPPQLAFAAPQAQPPPVINVYQQPPDMQHPNVRYQGPFRPQGMNRRDGRGSGRPGGCWNCGDYGHYPDRCPRPRASEDVQHSRGRSQRGGGRGPVNPWAGPNFGY